MLSSVQNLYNNPMKLDDRVVTLKGRKDFLGDLLVRTLCFHYWRHWFYHWSGNYDVANHGVWPNIRCKKELPVTVGWQVATNNLDSCLRYSSLPCIHPPPWLPHENPVYLFQLRKMLFWGEKGPIWQNVVSIILFLEKASVTTVAVIIIFKTLNYRKLFTKKKYTIHSQFADVNMLSLFVWSGHSWWLFSCSLSIRGPPSVCFTSVLHTWLTFLGTCHRPQLVIVLIKGWWAARFLTGFPGN